VDGGLAFRRLLAVVALQDGGRFIAERDKAHGLHGEPVDARVAQDQKFIQIRGLGQAQHRECLPRRVPDAFFIGSPRSRVLLRLYVISLNGFQAPAPARGAALYGGVR